MNSFDKNMNFETVPNQEINTKEIFGTECGFKVFGFKSLNDHVPLILDLPYHSFPTFHFLLST